MKKHTIPDPSFNFKPKFVWPEPNTNRECPKCEQSLQLLDEAPNYFGKPWWCPACQWQFSEEELTAP